MAEGKFDINIGIHPEPPGLVGDNIHLDIGKTGGEIGQMRHQDKGGKGKVGADTDAGFAPCANIFYRLVNLAKGRTDTVIKLLSGTGQGDTTMQAAKQRLV